MFGVFAGECKCIFLFLLIFEVYEMRANISNGRCRFIFMQPKYKEASAYVVKYRLCLCKAMQLMKTYVTNAFQAATQQVTDSKEASAKG